MTYRIFISYSRMDEGFTRRLAQALNQLGFNLWVDIEDIRGGTK